jgi:integrase
MTGPASPKPTALTETAIAKAVRTAKETKTHTRLPAPGKEGLWLSVGKTGTVRWEARMRVPAEDNAPRWIGLGQPPKIGLMDARARYDAVRVAARAGTAVSALRAIFDPPPVPPTPPTPNRPTDPAPDSLAAKLKLYEAQGDPGKSWPHSRKRIDRVFKAQLTQSVATLTAVTLQEVADTYPARQSAAFAVRTLRPALRWLAKRKHCAAELATIEQPVTVRKRERRLSRMELAATLPVLGDGPVVHGRCLQHILYTGCRLGEALEARWRDIDWREGLWTIPQTKSGIEHVIPLSWQAVAWLHHHRPVEAAPDGLIFGTEAGRQLGNWDRVWKHFLLLSGLAQRDSKGGVVMNDGSLLPHRHDLRRTAATLMGELGTAPHIVESVLGHVTVHTGLAGIYNRSRYRPEMATALQRLADLLDELEYSKADLPLGLAA